MLVETIIHTQHHALADSPNIEKGYYLLTTMLMNNNKYSLTESNIDHLNP